MRNYRITVSKSTKEKPDYYRHYFTVEMGIASKGEVVDMVADFRDRFPSPMFWVLCMSSDPSMIVEHFTQENNG